MDFSIRYRLAALTVTALLAAGELAAATPKTPDALEGAKLALRLRDFPTALAKLQQSAGAGNAEAQLLLGLVNLNGVGTAIDRTAAESWLSKSAAQNNAYGGLCAGRAGSRNRTGAQPGEAQAPAAQGGHARIPVGVEDERAGRLPLSADWAGLGRRHAAHGAHDLLRAQRRSRLPAGRGRRSQGFARSLRRHDAGTCGRGRLAGFRAVADRWRERGESSPTVSASRR